MKDFQAAIIDLDGVLTTTATQHSRSWKQMFDLYNGQRKKQGQKTFAAFSEKEDYPKYIDGIPRYDGVREFLKSRGIALPAGEPADEPGKETICGLGNLKNQMFLEIIKKEGVGIFEKNIMQIKSWKAQGIKTAVISSSKNCRYILQAAGIEDLFDARVDGVISVERNIPGKPAPDIFLEAARELGVDPAHALIAEDSQAGVAAGRSGNFGLVVGIQGASTRKELFDMGADEVVKNLRELELRVGGGPSRHPHELPHAMEHVADFKKRFKKNRPFIFLDFDGTLAPIVEKHEDAGMSAEMKEMVKELASAYDVAVVSGRGMADVKERVGLENIHYAGSHGFEMSGPGGFFKEHDEAQKVLPLLDELEPRLKKELSHIDGVRLERKKFTLAVHYRQVADDKVDALMDIVDHTMDDYKELKKGKGKKVLELRPYLDWDKGKAVEMLLKVLGEGKEDLLPVYIGDDLTDEDAFRVMENGIAILVGDHGEKTYAGYFLKNVNEVKEFLGKLKSTA